jgi:uncharacterized Fe-S cluster-containing protein
MKTEISLPNLDCGLCGYRTCKELAQKLPAQPALLKRCIHLSKDKHDSSAAAQAVAAEKKSHVAAPCANTLKSASACQACSKPIHTVSEKWKDSLGRDFDFYLEHFPADPGPREIIIPHNPMITREMDIKVGDIMIGRPLGMSCGCPITHCGTAVEVDQRTGVITWCVTGPLATRGGNYKDLGYYIAEGYEGIITEPRSEIKIGLRYYFQPRMCMLQWRHSGLVNFINKNAEGLQVRLEGLWIG